MMLLLVVVEMEDLTSMDSGFEQFWTLQSLLDGSYSTKVSSFSWQNAGSYEQSANRRLWRNDVKAGVEWLKRCK